MLNGIHFLLSYQCNSECDHCFVYSGPHAKGTFTLSQIREVLDEAERLGSIKSIYFEGGEPFLFYPIMLEGIKAAREKGFKVKCEVYRVEDDGTYTLVGEGYVAHVFIDENKKPARLPDYYWKVFDSIKDPDDVYPITA